MMICKMRDKPFDVLIKNRNANMTSVGCATQLVDECQVKRRKGSLTNDYRAINRREIAILKNSSINHSFQTDTIYFELFELSTSFVS